MLRLAPGTRLSHYRIIEQLGEGGQATAYKAEDVRLSTFNCLGVRIIQPAVAARDESSIATRLLRAVIAKSSLELSFICVLATWAAFANYSPLLRGAIDVAEPTRVAGWAYDPLAPEEALEVQLFIDDQFVAARRAAEPRPDLVEAGATRRPNHGFTFTIQLAPGRHSVQVYAVRAGAGAHKALAPLAKASRIIEVSRQ